MKIAVLLLVLVLLPFAVAEDKQGNFSQMAKYNLSEIAPKYNFKVNITVSQPHKATYTTWYTRPGNFSRNVSNSSLVGKAPTPQLKKTADIHFDVIRQNVSVKFDPRSCPDNVAYCYQIIDRPQNATNPKNYSGFAAVNLPAERMKTFLCIGNNTACVADATNCFCPTQRIPVQPQLKGQAGKCTSDYHVCKTQDGNFVRCEGTLASCQARYASCGCGPAAACTSKKNTCLNTRNQLIICKAGLSDCLGVYSSCFCGPDAMMLQSGCTSATHRCQKGNELSFCSGTLASCALQYDTCDC